MARPLLRVADLSDQGASKPYAIRADGNVAPRRYSATVVACVEGEIGVGLFGAGQP